MKKLFFAMLALVALASCSKDEVVQLNQDEIKYSVVAENATKAADVYCSNNKFTQFYVYANVNEGTTDAPSYKEFINHDVVTFSNDVWKSYGVSRFWPDSPVNFYAVVNPGATELTTWSPTTGAAPALKFTPKTDIEGTDVNEVESQLDLMYATAAGCEKSDNKDVELNFRHALSQIVFKARVDHRLIHVDITNVEICNLYGTNTYTWPTSSTTTAVGEHANGNPTGITRGSWATLTEAPADGVSLVNYAVDTYYNAKSTTTATANDVTSVAYTKSESALEVTTPGGTNLTDNPNINHASDGASQVEDNFSKAMLLLPQKRYAYGSESDNGATKNGVYVKLTCKIYNVANATAVDREKDVILESVGVAMPLAIDWKEGYKYIYTIVFGANTSGGLEIDPEDGTPTDEPVLVNVDYEVTVDGFIDASQETIYKEYEVEGEGQN